MKQVKRAVLFGIDGGGTFFEQARTPNMDRIFAGGAVSRRTLTEIPTISAECWGAMLHGVECGWHGLTNAIVSSAPYPVDSDYPSVFRAIREARPEAKLASFCDWDPINGGIIEDNLGVFKYHASARDLVEPAVQYIRENDFTFLFFQFDNVDGAGHRYGYGTPEHLAAISDNDGYIGAIMAAIEEQGWLEDTLILVEADHGGTPNAGFGGHHGGGTEEEKYVSFFAAGPGVKSGEVRDMLVRDTSAVILRALGIPQPESWTARIPGGLLEDCPEGEAAPAGIPPLGWRRELPALEEKGEFLKKFADLEPLLYLPFETDEEMPRDALAHGKLYRQAGRIGQAMGFADGGLELDCPSLAEGYTVMFWVRADKSLEQSTGIAVAAGTSCRQASEEPGFCVEIGGKFVRGMKNGCFRQKACLLDMTGPGEMVGNWNHVIFTVNPTAGQLCLRINFGKAYYYGLPAGMAMLHTGKLYIGMDELGRDEKRLPAVLDDLCLCRRIPDEEALARLKAYYQV